MYQFSHSTQKKFLWGFITLLDPQFKGQLSWQLHYYYKCHECIFCLIFVHLSAQFKYVYVHILIKYSISFSIQACGNCLHVSKSLQHHQCLPATFSILIPYATILLATQTLISGWYKLEVMFPWQNILTFHFMQNQSPTFHFQERALFYTCSDMFM
jgi:hypothetical protein